MVRKTKKRVGATAIELALTLPILFFILFAAYESARANLLRHTARAAAYEGARVGILPGAQVADVEASARSVLATIGISNSDVTVTPDQLDNSAAQVRVEVSIEANGNFFFVPFFFRNGVFRGDCQLTREILY